jgi:hypothetical protein
MTYHKPEIEKLNGVLNAIRGNLKSQRIVIENDPAYPPYPMCTPMAYEADE